MAVTGTEAKIADALFWHVGQLTTNPATDVAYPNVAFTPAGRSPYRKVEFIPNLADLVGIAFDSSRDFQGLLQVSVFWKAGDGLVKPTQVAAQIAAHFAPGTRIARNGITVRIDQKPRVISSIQEPDWTQIPVSIAWRAFVTE